MAATTPVYLARHEMDDDRWNAAVDRDEAHLPYGLTWWMDAVVGNNWAGLVLGDYRVVLPLPHFRKIGPFRKIARPSFTQQVGPWGNPNAMDCVTLLSAIDRYAWSVDIGLRESLSGPSRISEYELLERVNLVLDLSPGYDAVAAGYHKSVRRKLRRYPGDRLAAATISQAIANFKPVAGEKAGLKSKHYSMIRNLATACAERGAGATVQLLDAEGSSLATGFFPEYRGRVINLFPASTKEGYRLDGMLRLVDAVIRDSLERHHTFDFEGSDYPGIARFFGQFGPVNRPYSRAIRKSTLFW